MRKRMVKLRRVAGSMVVSVPRECLELGFEEGTVMEAVFLEGGVIVMKPVEGGEETLRRWGMNVVEP